MLTGTFGSVDVSTSGISTGYVSGAVHSLPGSLLWWQTASKAFASVLSAVSTARQHCLRLRWGRASMSAEQTHWVLSLLLSSHAWR